MAGSTASASRRREHGQRILWIGLVMVWFLVGLGALYLMLVGVVKTVGGATFLAEGHQLLLAVPVGLIGIGGLLGGLLSVQHRAGRPTTTG